MIAPGCDIAPMNALPVARQSVSKHSAWKNMIAAYGPSRKNSPIMYVTST